MQLVSMRGVDRKGVVLMRRGPSACDSTKLAMRHPRGCPRMINSGTGSARAADGGQDNQSTFSMGRSSNHAFMNGCQHAEIHLYF